MNRAPCLLFWFSLTLVVSLGLYHTSYRVDSLTRDLRALNAKIESEQRNIHVLKAEWVFLANPARIEAAAKKHLALEPTKTSQIASLKKLSDLLPARRGASVYAARPIATLASRHAVYTPKSEAGEADRVNTRVSFAGPAPRNESGKKTPYRLAGDDSYGIGSFGGSP